MKENADFSAECKNPTYFAASNSGIGFVSYFDKIFRKERFDKIYIIKGGPGTGKSSLLKAMRDTALKKGFICEGILCSSDKSSYDGVTIDTGKKSIALLDGTAPHAREAEIPGAVEEVIDLGQFWISERLERCRESIITLAEKKKERYQCAYSLLGCAENYASYKRKLLRRCIDEDKLSSAITRLLSPFKNCTAKRSDSYKLKNAISADGYTSLPIYSHEEGVHFAVCGAHGASFAFFDILVNKAKEKKLNLTLSPSPLSPDIFDAAALTDQKVYYYLTDDVSNVDCKVINTQRFLIDSRLREIKPTLRMLSRLEKGALESAYKVLSDAKKHHFALEDIYIGAMDFEKKEKLQKELIEKIL